MDTVFFDMDGTLIDTEKYYNVCWCEAIAKFGYTITKEEALDLRSLGRPHVYRFFEEKYGHYNTMLVVSGNKNTVKKYVNIDHMTHVPDALKLKIKEVMDNYAEKTSD